MARLPRFTPQTLVFSYCRRGLTKKRPLRLDVLASASGPEPLQHPLDLHGMPLGSTRCSDAALAQGLRDPAKRGGTRGADLSEDGLKRPFAPSFTSWAFAGRAFLVRSEVNPGALLYAGFHPFVRSAPDRPFR